MITGLGDYIRQHAPYAIAMGSAEYDDYYKAPWATSPFLEQRHRQLSAQIGTALKGGRYHIITENTNNNLFLDIGVLSYIIMYGLLFYSVSDVNLRRWETPHSDHLLIKRVSRGDKYIIYIYNRLSSSPLDEIFL